MEMKKYRNPIWQDKNNRHLVCEMLQGNGMYTVCHVIAGPESEGNVNADYDAIIAEYGIAGLDERTKKFRQEKDRQRKIKKEKELTKATRARQEILFNLKLEAFEIDVIKNSKNRELKKLIRKSKSPLEVQAYTAVLIGKELDASNE